MGTCDKAMCDTCAVSVGENLDYCGAHFRYAEAMGRLPK